MRNCMMKRSTLQIWVQGNVVSSGFLCVEEMILIHITQGGGGWAFVGIFINYEFYRLKMKGLYKDFETFCFIFK